MLLWLQLADDEDLATVVASTESSTPQYNTVEATAAGYCWLDKQQQKVGGVVVVMVMLHT